MTVADRPISDYQFERFSGRRETDGGSMHSGAVRRFLCRRALSVPNAIVQKWSGWKQRGEGQLVAFTCIAIGPPEMIEEGYDRNNPYCSGAVELVEGPRVVARIEGVDTLHPETIKIGMPVKATFLRQGANENQKIVLGFTPVSF